MAQGRRNKEIKETRKAEAFKLRSQGYTYRQIAAKMKIDVKAAYDLSKERLREVTKVNNQEATEWVAAEIEACDEMIGALVEYAFVKGRGKNPKLKPNLSVIAEIRSWRSFRADVSGHKVNKLDMNMNVDIIAKKLKDGLKQMDESAGA